MQHDPPKDAEIIAVTPRGLEAKAGTPAMDPGAANEEADRARLTLLRQEHRDLDEAIHAMQSHGSDPFTIKRMKTQKLRLKDRIAQIEDRLTPDIIA